MAKKRKKRLMTTEWAFCSETASMSGEHLWSDWMNKIIPGKKEFAIKDESRQVIKNWTGPERAGRYPSIVRRIESQCSFAASDK
jgi:hypothetical protein